MSGGPARAAKHYDLGNDLFESMLDRRMIYSCAYWKGASNLDEAQEAKLDLTARKIGLRPGRRVLDIGCGWGGFARFAAENYGARVVGVTISRQQYKLAKNICAGLPVELRLQDYREINDRPFDAAVALGVMEHVGHKNYRTFLEVVRRLLKAHGLFLLQTIGSSVSEITADPWTVRNIFPYGVVPSARQITSAAEGRWVIEDWHNFGADYDKTLMAWFANFRDRWPRLRDRYGDRFHRMWKCCLLMCAGAFRVRDLQLWQIVLSPAGVPGRYASVR